MLQSLENNLKNTSCPLSDTAQLLAQVMQYLPEDHQEYNLALHMVDSLHSFKDSEDMWPDLLMPLGQTSD